MLCVGMKEIEGEQLGRENTKTGVEPALSEAELLPRGELAITR